MQLKTNPYLMYKGNIPEEAIKQLQDAGIKINRSIEELFQALNCSCRKVRLFSYELNKNLKNINITEKRLKKPFYRKNERW